MREDRTYSVYILGSISGTLYVGVTGNLRRRMSQHKNHVFLGFSAEHGVDRLLYWEKYLSVGHAIAREKQLKGWIRKKKIALIERDNPGWRDLAGDWFEASHPMTLGPHQQSGRE
jgi:putative endonuclease